jgi:hypothetical protein
LVAWYATCMESLRQPAKGGIRMERSGSSGVMAVMVVALVAIIVVFLLVSGAFAPQGGGIDIHL